ncbi:MAG: hypothetical protein B6I20_05860 [Bacteroidetes bacterium 4572_117]|nr:MAG: hypothetical protein B6I20_05860 [Bacteroidetes bacterium 4572_117]
MKISKKSILLILILFVFFNKNANAQQMYSVNGIVKSKNLLIAGCNVRVYSENELFHSNNTLANGYFQIKLPYNKNYLVVFSKEKYHTNTIRVSTYVPTGYENKLQKSKIFKLELITEHQKTDETIKNYQIDPSTGNLIEITERYVNNVLLNARSKANVILSKAKRKADNIIDNAEKSRKNIIIRNTILKKQNDSLINKMKNEINKLENQKENLYLLKDSSKIASTDSLIKLNTLIRKKQSILNTLYDELEKAKLNNDSSAIIALEEKMQKLKPEIDLLKSKINNYKNIIQLNELELKQKSIYINTGIVIGVLILILLLITLLLYKNKVRNNRLLSQKNIELDKQKNKIKEQHNDIKSSIKYASYIQTAFLKIKKQIINNLDFFIYYKPKDIVSGDFFWLSEIEPSNNKIQFSGIVAVVDCTGHGVPGAFMSMLGNSLLDEIVLENKIYEPNEILRVMNHSVVKRLNQAETNNRDGMDVCLCRIDKYKDGSTKVIFSGAKRPLIYYNAKENKIDRIKGSILSVGGLHWMNDEFTNIEIECNKDDVLFLTTDGFVDQNSHSAKRYGTKKFINLLKSISNYTTQEQKYILGTEMENFRKDVAYRDDMAIVGIKIT